MAESTGVLQTTSLLRLTGSQLSQVALPAPMEDKNSAYDLR